MPGIRKRVGWRHCRSFRLRADPAVSTDMRLWLTFAAVAAGALADLQCVPPDDVTHLCWPGRQSGLFAVQHSRKPWVHGRDFTLCPAHGRVRTEDHQSAPGSFAHAGCRAELLLSSARCCSGVSSARKRNSYLLAAYQAAGRAPIDVNARAVTHSLIPAEMFHGAQRETGFVHAQINPREDRARADRTRLCGGPATIYPVATCAAFSDVQEGPWQ